MSGLSFRERDPASLSPHAASLIVEAALHLLGAIDRHVGAIPHEVRDEAVRLRRELIRGGVASAVRSEDRR